MVETMSFLVSKHSLYVPFTLSLSAFKDLQIRQLNIYLSYATLNVALQRKSDKLIKKFRIAQNRVYYASSANTKLLYNVLVTKLLSSSSNKFRFVPSQVFFKKEKLLYKVACKRMRSYCTRRNPMGVMCTVSSHHCQPQNIFFNKTTNMNQQRNNLTKQNIKIISFDKQHLKSFSNTLFLNTQMLLLVILLKKDVSHSFDVLVSVICPV